MITRKLKMIQKMRLKKNSEKVIIKFLIPNFIHI